MVRVKNNDGLLLCPGLSQRPEQLPHTRVHAATEASSANERQRNAISTVKTQQKADEKIPHNVTAE